MYSFTESCCTHATAFWYLFTPSVQFRLDTRPTLHWQQTAQKTSERSNAQNKAGSRGLCGIGMFILGKITTSMGLEVSGVRSVNSASRAKLKTHSNDQEPLAARSIRSATTLGCETYTAWLPGDSTMVALARVAIIRCTRGGIMWSSVDTR